MRSQIFTTSDIELSACIFTAGVAPLKIAPGRELVEFVFPINGTVNETILGYSSGTLCQPVRKLVKHRSWLYKQVRDVEQYGREVIL